MIKTGDVALHSIPPPASPPLPQPQPPPSPPIPPSSVPTPATAVFRHDQIATIKRNLNFLQRATQQPPPSGSLPPHPSAPALFSPPNTPVTQPPPSRQDCYIVEPAWTTFKSHFQVPYHPPGYSKNAAPAFPCPPPPLGHIDTKPPELLPPPIRRPSAEPIESSSSSFEFALEAEKMVSELCSSSKDFSDKVSAIDSNRYEVCERRRHPEPWSIKPREVRTHDMDDYPQARITSNSNVNVSTKFETGYELPCIYEDDWCLRDFIIKGCIEVGNALKGHDRHSHFTDLIRFCRMVRESAESTSAQEYQQDEVRSQILTFFRLASSWLSICPLIDRTGVQRDEFRNRMYRHFSDWQISTRRMMELIIKNVPVLKERMDSEPNADALAYGDQLHKRQPFSPMHYDPQSSMENLKRQRSVPNFQGHHRQWRPRRFSDNHYEENHAWHRNPQNQRDVNNRNKWTIVSPDIYHQKPPNQNFRKPEVQCVNYQDKTENRYRPKMHPAECIPGRSVFSDNDKKWTKYHLYPEAEQGVQYKTQDDDSHSTIQDDVVQHNHMVLLSQIEPRCIQKHNDQQPVDLDALFQGYRVANENPKNQSFKVPNQGQMRYGCRDKMNPHNRGRRWYNNYNFCPPPWATNANYDRDDPHDGVYMKPGSYDVPKRDQKPVTRQVTAPPPPPPAPTVTIPSTPRFKQAQTDEVMWQAALASAETFCKSFRSSENQGPQLDAQQEWMIRTAEKSSSECDGVEEQSHPGDGNETAAGDVAVAADDVANKSAVKMSKSLVEQKSLSMADGETAPPPPPPTSPPSKPPQSTSPPSQPLSARCRSLSPSASQKLRRFLETVWAVNEASQIKFSPDQENRGLDGKKVLEDTFQRLLEDGWSTGGATAATAAAPTVGGSQSKPY